MAKVQLFAPTNRTPRRTVSQDWFASDTPTIDQAHLSAFPNGSYYRALFQYAMEQTTEDYLNARESN
jgi:hypothetical protein